MSTSRKALERATAIVGGLYTGPDCVEAAALTVEIGTRLGYDLDARAVSMFATTFDGKQSTSTGGKGRAFGENWLRSRGVAFAVGGAFTGGIPFEREAGHMIVVSAEERLLLDPTFHQFDSLGDAAQSLFVDEVDAQGGGQFWETGDDTFFVRYFATADFGELNFEKLRAAVSVKADEIVDHI